MFHFNLFFITPDVQFDCASGYNEVVKFGYLIHIWDFPSYCAWFSFYLYFLLAKGNVSSMWRHWPWKAFLAFCIFLMKIYYLRPFAVSNHWHLLPFVSQKCAKIVSYSNKKPVRLSLTYTLKEYRHVHVHTGMGYESNVFDDK